MGLTGVEPVTSSLSGTRSNQLSYKPVAFAGGGSRIRTGDILLAKQALYQLSHAPTSSGRPPQGRRGGGTLERSARGLQHRPPEGPSPQKGGDPTAGSPTVTLLRLHPNHHPHLRPNEVRTSGADGFHDVTGGVYKARERIHGAVADAPLLAFPPPRGMGSLCTGHCSTCAALGVRAILT